METKLKIIEKLANKTEGIHLRELTRILKTGLPNIVRYANILEKESVIKKEKTANLVRLKLKEGLKTIAYLKQIHTERFLSLPEKIKSAIVDFIDGLETVSLIILIFCSYS